MAIRTAAVLVLVLMAGAPVASDAAAANPIRKVVNMLQNMVKKVSAEREKETELYEKFMCYCKTGLGALEQSIADAEAKIAELEAAAKGSLEKKAQLEEDLKAAKAGRAEAKEAMAKAGSIRDKEAGAFSKESSDRKTNLAAMDKAIAAVEKGMGSAFLQTSTASALRSIAVDKVDMNDASRQELLAFLSGTQTDGYAPQSGEITGILKTMFDEMTADEKDAAEAEQTSVAEYESMMAAKKKEVEALTGQIEEKTQRFGDLAVEVATMENDIEDTKEAFAEDSKFLAELKTSCGSKTKLYEENQKMRGEELVALAETIKVLNDDDALELFKKTLPSASASFLQVEVSAATVKSRALAMIRSAQRPSRSLDLISLALRGKKIGFEKVVSMIDEMTGTLKQEQKEDDEKKEYCAAEFDSSDDQKKALQQSVADSETAIDESEGAIEALKDEIKALVDGIKALDKSVADATEQRKEENSEYKELMANDGAAKEILGFAKNRLNKFYNPKLYKAPPKRELSEEDQITVNMGGTLAPTAAPGGIAGTGISALQGAPPPPPETMGAYTKSSEEGGGVIAMIDLLVKDLDKEMTVAESEEKDAQSDYEKLMEESAAKRAGDSKAVSDKEGATAELEEALQKHKDAKKSAGTELMQTLKYIQSLHGECDWLIQYYGVRKEARTNEIDAMGKAKDVLNGADYSLLQTTRRTRRFLGGMKGCGPQTKLETTSSQDAAGTAQFVGADFVDGQCKLVGSDKITALKFCGPGTLVVSRMTCQSHDYKANTFEHSSADYTTNCQTISLAGTVADGWLGSYSVSC